MASETRSTAVPTLRRAFLPGFEPSCNPEVSSARLRLTRSQAPGFGERWAQADLPVLGGWHRRSRGAMPIPGSIPAAKSSVLRSNERARIGPQTEPLAAAPPQRFSDDVSCQWRILLRKIVGPTRVRACQPAGLPASLPAAGRTSRRAILRPSRRRTRAP